jgi:hypothetical protein
MLILGSPIDRLFQEWHQLGGAILLAEKSTVELTRSPEAIIAESTAYCRASSRLMWIVVEWLIGHIDQLDEQRLIDASRQYGDLGVLGVVCNVAYLKNPHPKFEQIMAACVPQVDIEPFFYRVAQSPLATQLAQQEGLDVFRKWNYWCREIRYL